MICEDQVNKHRAANEACAKELCELAALVNAATSRLVTVAAEFDRNEGWSGDGHHLERALAVGQRRL